MSTVLIVDDHVAFSKGLRLMMKEIIDVDTIEELHSGEDFLIWLESSQADLVFIDIRMPGISGIEASRQALKLYPELKIIVLTMFGEYQYMEEAIETRARGFLLKPPGLSELKEAYTTVMNGGLYFPTERQNHV